MRLLIPLAITISLTVASAIEGLFERQGLSCEGQCPSGMINCVECLGILSCKDPVSA